MLSYHQILSEYLQTSAIPAMLREGWAFKAAKAYQWEGAKRGPEFHVDQSLRTHILNGLYNLTAVVEYLHTHSYGSMSEADFRRTLIYYTLHDAYKDRALKKLSPGTFDVPLEELDSLIERMGLRHFCDINAAEIRMASVSLLSQKVADLQNCPPGTRHLLTFVHLADALASQQSARDYKTAERRLHDLTQHSQVAALQNQRLNKRLQTPLVTSEPLLPRLGLHYHEIDDYRGVSTLLIHQIVEALLQPFQLTPLLYFPNGILYIGPENVTIDTQALKKAIPNRLLALIRETAKDSISITEQACQYGQSLKFRKDVYLFSSLETLLTVIQDRPLAKKATGFLNKTLEKRVSRKKYQNVQEFYDLYGIPPRADEDEALAQRWNAVYIMLMGIENIAEALIPGPTLEWLLTTFQTPPNVADTVRRNSSALRTGGVSDHCYIIAYHWLTQQSFLENSQRPALEVEISSVQAALHAHASQALTPHDRPERRQEFVNRELGIAEDIASYLDTYLSFSFDQDSARTLDDQRLILYEKARSRSSHKRTCLICNRDIPPAMKSNDIITSIADQQALVFSNKLQPAPEVKGQMIWCPMCYLEFMLRKLNNQGYPPETDYNASCRLYLYILPDYSFTPQLWQDMGNSTMTSLLRNFHPEKTTVTRLLLRSNKDNPAVPQQWLTNRRVDPEWLEYLQNTFGQQALLLQQSAQNKKQRQAHGNRLTFSLLHPNYMLMTYDNTISKSSGDKALAPTRTEVWAKALYTAALVHLLIGARVYVTDRPYLTITRPEQMKTIIEVEGLPPLLYSLFAVNRSGGTALDTATRPSESNARVPIATLPVLLDLLAAVWEITAGLYPYTTKEPRNLDKQVASILAEIRGNALAGATFYKMRERSHQPPYPQFTRACQLLLAGAGTGTDEIRRQLHEEGYELLMDTRGNYFVELAQKLTSISMKLFLPLSKPLRGRAHRYERIFRAGIEVIKNNTRLAQPDLIGAVAGRLLKTLERASGGVRPTYGAEQTELVQAFATILVKDLYLTHCDRSTSKLTHLENALADSIYFFTSQHISQSWQEWQERKKKDPRLTQEETLLEKDDETMDNLE
jgi:hypothetical protein